MERPNGVQTVVSDDGKDCFFISTGECDDCGGTMREVLMNPASKPPDLCESCAVARARKYERERWERKNAVRRTAPIHLSAQAVGAASELIVCTDLIMRGLDPYRAVNPGAPFDIVACSREHTYRVEVKSSNQRANGTFQHGRLNGDNHDIVAHVLPNGRVEYRPDILPGRVDLAVQNNRAFPDQE